ncbi:RNA exonuclease [Verticillium alfalfae VaMs.102]|uniref:RNA exonuclease 4 n=1 Tax=Verticillium alfalfae (strain VaMs.102 / ATCC MYA-4576 / FGSC 10136) TaxID=526221 RepID=C9STR3_VERA1|nr:RNA exonuclease [Verticillium alfalfae VaMs.102]EEY22224.1 RNA exonuclease [Verticillium alfalfae VaMs.102]
MARELSSNWKQLQAQIQAESSSKPDGKTPSTLKRKASGKPSPRPPRSRRSPSSPRQLPPAPAPPSHRARRPRRGKGPPRARRPRRTHGRRAVVQGWPDPARTGPSPSLAAWAAENDVSAESLAEAYGLGPPRQCHCSPSRRRRTPGRTPGLDVGKSTTAFVRPREKVTDWRTAVSGIAPRKMRLAREFEDVQAEVAELLQDRILIGHDVKHDLDALQLTHSIKDIRDTSKFPGFRQYGNGKKPALRKLAGEILKVEIQQGAHSSVEDAKVTMALFRRHKPAFDVDNTNRFPTFAPGARSAAKKPKKKKK